MARFIIETDNLDWTSLGKNFLVRLIIRPCINTTTDRLSVKTNYLLSSSWQTN